MHHSCNAGWLTYALKETCLKLEEKLSESYKFSVLVVDPMCFSQQHPFLEGETFSQYQERFLFLRSLS